MLACGCYHRITAQPIDGSAEADAIVDASVAMNDAGVPAITRVQRATVFWNNTGALMTLTYPFAQQAHDLNLVVVGWLNTHTVSDIHDDAGNAYTAAGQVDYNGMHQKFYFACDISGLGQNTVHVALDTSAQVDLRIVEYSGIRTTGCEDKIASKSGSTTNDDSGSVTTTFAHELLFATTFSIGGPSVGDSSFTDIYFDSWPNVLETKEVFATGTYHATATQNNTNDWVMQIVTFKGY